MKKDYLRRLALYRLIENASPIPAQWISKNNVTGEIGMFYSKSDGLWFSRDITEKNGWAKRCEVKGGEHLPWALWAGLRALGVDTLPADPEGPAHEIKTDVGDGAIAIADGYRITFRRKRDGDFLLRLGRRDGSLVLVPGATIEEKALDKGFKLLRSRAATMVNKTLPSSVSFTTNDSEEPLESMAPLSLVEDDFIWYDGNSENFQYNENENSTDYDINKSFDFDEPYSDAEIEDAFELAFEWDDTDTEAYARLADLLDLEYEHAKAWMEADKQLAMVALLGPLPMVNQHGWLWRRHKGGYVSSRGYMTKAGWWRLAYLSKQGVGLLERHRQKRLSRVRHPRHLRLTQKLCLDLVQNQGCVPLGVEYSALAYFIAQDLHHYRSDALLIDPDGALVWVEIMRRELRRLGDKTKMKYELLEKDFLPPLADRLQRPIRYILKVPSGIEEKIFYPETEPAF